MSDPVSPTPEPIPVVQPRDSLELIGCPLFRPGELANVPAGPEWIWHGYLARGQITLLTGQWKIGKTALLGCLLARLGAGGPLADREVRPGRAIVLTEEGAGLWMGRCRTFGIGDHTAFAFRPLGCRPITEHWKLLTESVARLHRRQPLDLLVIDPLATLWPCRDENNAAGVMDAMEPLRDLAGHMIAVLLVHHPRKERAGGGRESRGSGALAAFVDILIEMHWYARPDAPDRRRRLLAWSRHDATPRQWLVEMTADGTDYVPGSDDAPGASLAVTVRRLLESEPNLTARELLGRWPPDVAPPRPTVLHRHLSQAVERDQIICTGAGHRYEPYRYRLVDGEQESGTR